MAVSRTFVCDQCGKQQSGPPRTSVTGRRLCTACDDALTPEGPSAATAPAASTVPTPGDLVGTSWFLSSATSEGAPVVLPSMIKDLSLRFGADDFGASDGCNYHGGTASITATTLELTLGYSTLVACDDTADVVTAVLEGTSTWTLADGVLTIEHEGVGTLVYRAVPGVDPDLTDAPSATPPVTDPVPPGR